MRLALLLLVCWAMGAAELTLLTENYPPFNYEDQSVAGGINGSNHAIITALRAKLGHTGQVVLLPWSAAYDRALNEVGVGLYSTTRTPEREELFHWVGPLSNNDWGLFALKSRQITLAELADAAAYRIGTYRDDATDVYLRSQGLEASLKATTDDRLNARKLKMGSIDLWAGGVDQVPLKCRQGGVNPDEIVEVLRFQHSQLYLAISRQTDPAIAARWQAALNELRASGVLPALPSTTD